MLRDIQLQGTGLYLPLAIIFYSLVLLSRDLQPSCPSPFRAQQNPDLGDIH